MDFEPQTSTFSIIRIKSRDDSINACYIAATGNYDQYMKTFKYELSRNLSFNVEKRNKKADKKERKERYVIKYILEHGGWENWYAEVIEHINASGIAEARMKAKKFYKEGEVSLENQPLKPDPEEESSEKKIKKAWSKGKDPWHCDICNKTYTYATKSIHCKTIKHNELYSKNLVMADSLNKRETAAADETSFVTVSLESPETTQKNSTTEDDERRQLLFMYMKNKIANITADSERIKFPQICFIDNIDVCVYLCVNKIAEEYYWEIRSVMDFVKKPLYLGEKVKIGDYDKMREFLDNFIDLAFVKLKYCRETNTMETFECKLLLGLVNPKKVNDCAFCHKKTMCKLKCEHFLCLECISLESICECEVCGVSF